MSCIFCLNYNGIGKHCQKNQYVENTYESFDCNSLEWFVIDEDKALSTCKEYGYDFEELC